MEMMEINPGTRSVPGATVELAEAAVEVFVAELGEHEVDATAVRSPNDDVPVDAERMGGRYAWRLQLADDREVLLQVPGAPLDQIQARGSLAPCLAVDGEAWWWSAAVGHVVSAAQGVRSSTDPREVTRTWVGTPGQSS